MKKYPDLYILRHGQTEWNLQGRMQGRLDSPLTPLGQRQARQQGRILARLGLGEVDCFCSPQGRALHTARIALKATGQTAQEDTALSEVDMGSWQNCLASDLRRHCQPDLWEDLGPAWYFFNTPDGETWEQARRRCLLLLERLAGPSVLVTHGITAKVLRGLWLGLNYRDSVLLPGGQGCVFHLSNRRETCLWE